MKHSIKHSLSDELAKKATSKAFESYRRRGDLRRDAVVEQQDFEWLAGDSADREEADRVGRQPYPEQSSEGWPRLLWKGHRPAPGAQQMPAGSRQQDDWERQAEPAGALTITAPVLFGQLHVAPLVSEFIENFTQVQVDLLLLDRIVNLVEEGVDAGLRIAELEDSSMIATRLGAMRRVACASPGLLQKTGLPEHPTDLSERPCVRFSGTAAGDSWRFYEHGKSFAVAVGGRFKSNQAAAAVEACARGIGFGLFLAYQVAPLIAAGKLQVVLAEFEPPPMPVSLVYPHARLIATRTRVFLDWMAPRLRTALERIQL